MQVKEAIIILKKDQSDSKNFSGGQMNHLVHSLKEGIQAQQQQKAWKTMEDN